VTTQSETHSTHQAPSAPPEAILSIYVDLYKHHFELWLKSYLLYMAILGVAAGILFGKDLAGAQTSELQRFLLVFIAVVSLFAAIAFSVGLHWLIRFEKTLQSAVAAAGAPPFGIYPFKYVVFLGIVASIGFVIAAVWLALVALQRT